MLSFTCYPHSESKRGRRYNLSLSTCAAVTAVDIQSASSRGEAVGESWLWRRCARDESPADTGRIKVPQIVEGEAC